MKFVWAGNRTEQYSLKSFTLNVENPCDKLVVCAVDFYRVFLDGKFTCFGPERTQAGYSRKREILLNGVKTITIEVSGYNHNCYCVDRQLPFFGAEILNGENVVYTALDFYCTFTTAKQKDVSRFSGQRTGIEVYDYTKEEILSEEIYEVDAPIILNGVGDTCKYNEYYFKKISDGNFNGFDGVLNAHSAFNPVNVATENGFLVERDFVEKTKIGYNEINFELEKIKTGFINLEINALNECEIFLTMEEILVDNKWVFRRSGCNDLLYIKVPKGKRKFLSFEPYSFKHLKIIYKGNAEILPSLIALQNDTANYVSASGSGKLFEIFNSAKESFCQNAVDVFTDCPGRERAGWLCDSFFIAKSENFFTGKNDMTRCFLENFIISKTPELDERMLPKSFPSTSYENHYIPNWAMWFVLQLKDYYLRTNDRTLIDLAKDRVYKLVDFFKKYENEYGLLEDLESWVFIEWSACNYEDYVKGVNYPTNMLFSAMLEAVDFLYGDKNLLKKSKIIKENVIKLSFDGNFFADNSIRVDGNLTRCNEHLSETCQYYALYFNVYRQPTFEKKLIEHFGPFRSENVYNNVHKSCAFIGNYLRLYYLLEKGYYNLVLKEIGEYFYNMAKSTGTLWEHNKAEIKGSCNHGFTSVTAEMIVTALYNGNVPKNNKFIIEDINY